MRNNGKKSGYTFHVMFIYRFTVSQVLNLFKHHVLLFFFKKNLVSSHYMRRYAFLSEHFSKREPITFENIFSFYKLIEVLLKMLL